MPYLKKTPRKNHPVGVFFWQLLLEFTSLMPEGCGKHCVNLGKKTAICLIGHPQAMAPC